MKQSKRRFPRFAVVAAAVVCAWSFPAQAGQRITQLAEDAASTRQIPFSADAPSPTQVCEAGAKWIRLGFKELVLKGYDSLTIRGSDGASYTFEGERWNERSFSARALEGECVEIRAYFNDPGSRFQLESYQYGAQPLADTPVVVAGAGDICDSSGTVCAGTSDKIIEINPAAVFTAGDNVYTSGTLNEFNTLFNPYWGRFKELINPSPGNHEYGTSGAAGYFDYFNGSGVQTGPAGDRAKGYYSWDIGDWHFIALNSMSGGTVSQTQLDWLTADLAANTKPCTAAYWHHPLISVGNYSPGISQVKPFWDKLYAAHADLVLVGHDHNYQRFAPMAPDQSADANGLRQILIGTGGRRFYALRATHPQLEASTDSSFGVLKLTLTSNGYTGEFVRSTGTFTDTFTGTCHNAPPANQPPVADFSYTANGLSVQFTDASHDSDGSIATHAWTFGDGATSSDASPSHTYAGAGSYTVSLTVTDNGGLTHSKTTQVTVEGLYRIGGTVTGLAGHGLVLKLNGTDDLNVTSNGAFSFAGGLASGAAYAVSVGTQPGTPRQTCVVTNGSGSVAHADVADVAVTCTTATWTVTPAVSAGQGRIQPDVAQTVDDGATATFTLAPAQGWHVATATGCGGALNGLVYTTAAVNADCSVDVSFAIDTHVVSASVGAGQGAVTPVTQNVDYGATATVTLMPAQGYHAVSASGCGGTLSGNTYTTGPVTADCAVEAVFAVDRHTVSAVVEGGHGTIDPPTQAVDAGAAAHVTLTPDTGYVVDAISGDCAAGQLDGHAYVTGAVQADCTVKARFKLGDADVIFRNGFES